MSTLQVVPDLSVEELRAEVRKEYADVAEDPEKGTHFHTGREAATRLGYDETPYSYVPEGNIESFAGMGNPFILGPINRGEIVVDIGSGSARHYGGKPVPRGPSTFQLPGEAAFRPSQVIELSYVGMAKLPPDAQWSKSLAGPRRALNVNRSGT